MFPLTLWLAVYGATLAVVASLATSQVGALPLHGPLFATTSVLIALLFLVRGGLWFWRVRPESPIGAARDHAATWAPWILLRFALFQSSTLFFIWLAPIKSAIPDAAGYWADAPLIAIERAVFGTDPWRLLHALPDWITPAIDLIYASWIVVIVGVSMAVAVFGSAALVGRYFLSWAMAWVVLGIGIAYALPSAGPIFGPHLGFGFDDLHHALKGTVAYRFHEMLWAMQTARSGDLGGGISAMPSMHCALTSVFVAAAWKTRWRYLVMAYAAAIWFGSVYLGWHYALDGVVSALVVAMLWRVAERLADARWPRLSPIRRRAVSAQA